jgi:hypothetical protein
MMPGLALLLLLLLLLRVVVMGPAGLVGDVFAVGQHCSDRCLGWPRREE